MPVVGLRKRLEWQEGRTPRRSRVCPQTQQAALTRAGQRLSDLLSQSLGPEGLGKPSVKEIPRLAIAHAVRCQRRTFALPAFRRAGQRIAYAQPLLDEAYIPSLRDRPRQRYRWLMADKGYDTEALRRYCDRYRMQPVTPLRSMKRKPRPGLPSLYDRPKYRQRMYSGVASRVGVGDTIWLFSQLSSPWGSLPPALDGKIEAGKSRARGRPVGIDLAQAATRSGIRCSAQSSWRAN